MDAYIEFRNVVKKFDDFVALDHVSLQIPKGAFVTLLGPSGCGKTTLMRQLAGFSEPEEGDVLVDGKRMNGLPPFKRNTPLVFQEYALFPHMTVYENISYGLKLKRRTRRKRTARWRRCWRCSTSRDWMGGSRSSSLAASSSGWPLPGRW